MPEPSALPAGFVALHGNRSEALLAAVAQWLARAPLAPLEAETILVQSNGMAEWVKMTLAQTHGICAAVSAQLPARFQWRIYRQVLGREAVPARAPLDKTAATWRLMRLLPQLPDTEVFAPLADFLARDDALRPFQLARRIADLFDQYQVHRPDWLDDWARNDDVLNNARGQALPLPENQQWQAALWRMLLDSLDEHGRAAIRPALHARTLEVLHNTPPGEVAARFALPRRVVLFGMTHIPRPILELVAALSRHTQVLLAVPNPCRFYWADILDGREWLHHIQRRRHTLRAGVELYNVPLEAMHLHAPPLLAAWGRQSRDFIRQLDEFDDVESTRARFAEARIDLFDETPAAAGQPLLAQVQTYIRDLVPLAEQPHIAPAPDDRSIVFHVAHSAVRELEILHDQLLHLLAAPPPAGCAPLAPRDIVVMVPAIDEFAPAIRAIFGRYAPNDPRHIPFAIADLSARMVAPLVGAVQWLLELPQARAPLSELRHFLEYPAVAARFDVETDELLRLHQWMQGAGIRWGLDEAHREALALAGCGAQNTARFGVERMLMGFACGAAEVACEGIAPFDEVGGLEAELVGALYQLVERLIAWRECAATDATPAQWGQRLRALLGDFLQPQEDDDRQALAALHEALERWLAACDDAGFDAPLPLSVVAAAWLDELNNPRLERRFRAGGVTFCTLMPMRAIPFEVVCLLGMNDVDYPRRAHHDDFDLMATSGQRRAGDRARGEDDRQLMLEALLSARRQLYVSWSGRSVRDNSEQPPSVLVAQLRDYLAAGWGEEAVAQRTTEHPLQPFSRRYFEAQAQDAALFTYAREWRAAHTQDAPARDEAQVPPMPAPVTTLSVDDLVRFLKNPVQFFDRQRLGVHFTRMDAAADDSEPFALGKLDEYQHVDALIAAVRTRLHDASAEAATIDAALAAELTHLKRTGALPIAQAGEAQARALGDDVRHILQAWAALRRDYPHELPRQPLAVQEGDIAVQDWSGERRARHANDADAIWYSITASELYDKQGRALRVDKLLNAWLRALLAAACEQPARGVLIARDAVLDVPPLAMDAEAARAQLAVILTHYRQGLRAPLPVAIQTALCAVQQPGKDEEKEWEKVRAKYEGGYMHSGEVTHDAHLARRYPDFAALRADGRFLELARALYAPLLHWSQTFCAREANDE
ncbi:MAG: exodeoxyribonuclease V subunit gamma [Rhodocyclaceae bacterium]|nr:exodeoxyribonuclease V subunit gamma [Rhodocyclaceae bacterium]